MFDLPTSVTVSGCEYPIRTDFRVLRVREKLRTGKKLEKYERTWYNKNRDLVHLRPKFSKAEKKLIEAWT